MKHSGPILSIIATTTLLLIAAGLEAAEIRVAVASNFAETFAVIATQFERHTGHKVIQITGSTGKHYAQIRNGAPDAYFAADAERPEQLEQQGIALPGSRFTYALGKLDPVESANGLCDEEGRNIGGWKHPASGYRQSQIGPIWQGSAGGAAITR